MAIALVGSAGAVSTGTVGASVTPAWGAGANRTAGNLLLLPFSTTGVAGFPSNPSGWQLVVFASGTNCSAGVFFRIATGADAAPTVAGVTSAVINAQLLEFSGALQTSGVLALNSGAGNAGISPLVATLNAADGVVGTLMISATGFVTSSAGTMATLTETYNNATAVQMTNQGVSSTNHYSFSYGITTARGSADTDTVAFTATNTNGAALALATLNPAQAIVYVGRSSQQVTSSATTTSLTAVPGTQAGDIMFIGLLVGSTGGTFNVPTGFTPLVLGPTTTPYYGASAAMSTMCWYKVAVAGDNAGSFGLSWSAAGLAHASLYVVRGVNQKTPVLNWNANQAPSISTTLFSPFPSLAHPGVDGIFYLSMGMPASGSGSQTITGPSGLFNPFVDNNTAMGSVWSEGWDIANPSPGNTTCSTAVDYTAFAVELLPIGVVTSSFSRGSSIVRGTLSVTVNLAGRSTGTSSVRGTLLAAYPTISTLVDNFNTGSLSALWTNNAPTHITVANSRLELTTTTAIGAYTVTSVRPYSLTGDAIWVQSNPGNTAIVSYEFWPLVIQTPDGQNNIGFKINGTNLTCTFKAAGVQYTQGVALTYNSVTHAYLRIRETGGTIWWESSPSGTGTWTILAGRSNPFVPTTVIAGLLVIPQVDTTSVEASTTTAWVDNVNTITIISHSGASLGESVTRARLTVTATSKISMGTSTVRGALVITRVLSGNSSGLTRALAVVHLNNMLVGQGQGHTTAAAQLTTLVTVPGRSRGVSVAQARLLTTIGNAAGQTQGHTTARARLTLTAPMAGISTGRSTARGQLHITNLLRGRSLSATPAVLGTAFVQGRQRGIVTGHARALARLMAIRRITGQGAGHSTVRGTLHITINVAGRSTGHTLAPARLKLTRNVVARAAAGAVARARLTIAARQRGISTGHTTARAKLLANPRLLGGMQGHARVTGHLTVVVHVAGRSKGNALTRQHLIVAPPLHVRSTSHATAIGALTLTVGYHIDLGMPAPWLPGAVPEVEAVIVEGSLADHAILQPGQDRIWSGTTGYADDVFTTRLGGSTP